MKYLYHSPTGQDPIQIKIKEINKPEYEANDQYSIPELFQMKASNACEKIEIRQPDLYYKTAKSSKVRHNLTGWINLNEYEYGGTREKLTLSEALNLLN